MRVVALLSLLFGFMGLMLLDGQTFTHAVMGIIFGAAAFGCGLGSARKDFSNVLCRWEGRVMAGLGLVLVVVCVAYLPSAYRTQTRFNERIKARQEQKPSSATHRPGLAAGLPLLFALGHEWSGAIQLRPGVSRAFLCSPLYRFAPVW
jgi:hypothetical protein